MRLRKADREILAVIDSYVESDSGAMSPNQMKAWTSFYERVLRDELKGPKKRGGGLTVADAVKVLQGVLGRRLVLPAAFPRCGQSWYVQLQNRINASGLTAAHLTAAANVAADQWRGPIKAESLIRQADVLLADAEEVEYAGEAAPQEADMTEL
jgi:hypothetical protein